MSYIRGTGYRTSWTSLRESLHRVDPEGGKGSDKSHCFFDE